ncbi:MAG: DUF2341 domain-containing protein [Promethearchaeota archaeon]
MKKVKSKILVLTIILACNIISTIDIADNFIKINGFNNTRDNFYPDKLQTSQPPNLKNWWDSSYMYRVQINITNVNTKILPKGYSVNLSVNSAELISVGKLRADGNDLRILWYNSTNKTWLELDRVNETNFNTISTQIWFKTQSSISVGATDTNYYLYYGDEVAGSPPTNKSKVYDYYDDFTQADGPANGWTVISGTWSVINNEYRENSGLTDRRSLLNSYTVENASIEVRIKNVGISFGVGILFRYSDSNNFYCAGIGYWDREVAYGDCTGGIWETPVYDGVDESNLVSDQWYNLKVEALGSRFKIYLDDQLRIDNTNTSHLNAGQIGFLTWTTIPSYYDDLKIRLLVATSPSLTLESEETYGSWFNQNWKYRRKVTVTTGSSDIPSGYTVSLTFDHADLVIKGKSQADGDDIRLVYWNGTMWNVLDRMLDLDSSWNNESTKIWFKTQKPIQALSFDNNYYLYYGNKLANSPLVDPSNIFFFYDGFESGNLNGWDGNSTGSVGDSIIASTDQVHTGNYAAKCDMDNVTTPQAMVFEDFPDEASLYAHVHIYLDPSFSTTDRVTVIQFVDTATVWQNLISVTINDDMTLYMWNAVAGEAYGYLETNTISKGTWHTLDVQVNVSSSYGLAKLWLDGNLEIHNTSINLGSEPTDKFSTGIYWASPNEFNTLFVDDIYLRIFVEPEPTLTLSTEELLRPSLNSFKYYKEIIIDHTKISGSSNLTNFPILISLYDMDLHTDVQSNGNDIAFYDGKNWLDHEIELFNRDHNTTHAFLVSWVRIPSLSPMVDTKIYMYYGNSTMYSIQNPDGVWDTNYVGVWHLSEDPTNPIKDSTTNNNDGTSYGTMDPGDQIPGKLDGSLELDGIDDYVDCGNDVSLDLTENLTIQYWVMAYDVSNDPDTVTKGIYTDAYSSFIYRDRAIYFRLNGIGSTSLKSQTLISLNKWVSITCVRVGNTMKIFINGTQDPNTATFSEMIETIIDSLTIARSPDNLEGIMDEVRLSNIARSVDWIATEYNNQYDPSSFYSIGAEYQVGEDTTAPDININSPNPNELFGSMAPNYNLTVTDPNLDSIWYSLDGGTTNSTPVAAIGSLDQTTWNGRPNGTVIIRFYANDTLGNINYEEVIVRKDIIKPSVSIDSPSSGSNHSTPPSYSLSITEANLDEIWYTLNDGLNNYTGATSGTIDYIAWGNAGLGAVTITFFVNDSLGNWDSASVGVTKTSDLSISINSPSTAEWFGSIPDYDVYVSGNDRDSIWYTLDNGLNNYTITSNANQSNSWFGVIDSTAWDNAGQGSITLTFYLNNNFGIETSDTVQIYKDTINPSIDSIDSPLSGAWFSSLPPSYSLSITESNRDRIWYTLDGGVNNYTGALSGTINSLAWNNAGQGSITIIFYVNDSAGNWDTASVAIYRDTINPSIDSINSPLSGAWFSSLPPSYSLSITESNRDRIWYTLDGGLNNYTGALSGTINSLAWINAGQGSITIIFYVNDSAGNWDTASVAIYRDTVNPSIDSIDSPLPGAWFSSLPPSYTLSITESNRDRIWYTLDGGLNNFTGALSGTIDSTAWNTAGQGSITILFYVNDSAGNWDAASVVINRDSITPTIIITEPNNYDLFGISPPSITININDANLDNEWYQLDNGTIVTNNYTWTGAIAQSVWEQVGNGTIMIKFYANDTVGNLGTAEVIVYKDIFFPMIMINTPISDGVYGNTAPNYAVNISGSNLDTSWYTLDNGIVNYTFTGLTGTINQLAWDAKSDGTITISFYINNTLGVIGFDEITIIKDTIAPLIALNFPLNNTYCRVAPIINVLATDANLDLIWYQVNTTNILLGNNINQPFNNLIWNSLPEGRFYVYIYANDTLNHLSDPVLIVLYKDTIAPPAPSLIQAPQGAVSGTLIFEWQDGSDPSGIIKYRLIIDNEANPLATPGFVFAINLTGNYYEYMESLQPGIYYYFLYQIDGAGHQSPAATDSFSITSTSQPSEFPLWIIFVVIGAAIGGVVGIVVLKKSKSKKKEIGIQISEKQPVTKAKLKIYEELSLLDYETLKDKTEADLLARREKVIAYVNKLTEEKDYVKAAGFAGEIIIIEEILGNSQNADFYRQKQIDIAIKGLNYLKDQYEIESKKAAISGDYSKSLELYNESKIVSENLKMYVDNQESKHEQDRKLEITGTPLVMGEVELVYSCINDLLTKYFDEIGIKYYSNPQIYDDIQNKIHGLILFDDQVSFLNIDPSIRDRIRSIQIIYTEDTSNEDIIKSSKDFQNANTLLIIVVIKLLENNESFSFQGPMKNVRINHYKAFIQSIGLKGVYEEAFNEIIDLYYKGQFDILRETHELSEVIIHSTDELLYDLKGKGSVKHELKEYFSR